MAENSVGNLPTNWRQSARVVAGRPQFSRQSAGRSLKPPACLRFVEPDGTGGLGDGGFQRMSADTDDPPPPPRRPAVYQLKTSACTRKYQAAHHFAFGCPGGPRMLV